MTRKVIVTQGLPASGKSTWALAQLEQHPDRYKRVNRDSLRQMIDGGKWSQGREKQIREMELIIAGYFFAKGYTPIIDDCNLSQSAKNLWQNFAKNMQAEIEVQDFTDVEIEVCIERDRIRPNSVGEREIRKMHRMYLYTPPVLPVFDPALPSAICYDIDGTVALHHQRNPYDTGKCMEDKPHQRVIDEIGLHLGTGMVFLAVSGRKEQFRGLTREWLAMHQVPCDVLFMRKDGDDRPDYVIKQEIYDQEIVGKYNVYLIYDDRNQVVENVWRPLGLPCFQVADGAF